MSKRTKKVKHHLPAPTAIVSTIPAAILRHPDLSPGAKILFGCIDSLVHHYPKCFASNGFLADAMGIKERQLQNHLDALINAGLIARVLSPSKRRAEIKITWKAGSLVTPRRREQPKENAPSTQDLAPSCAPSTQDLAPSCAPSTQDLAPLSTQDIAPPSRARDSFGGLGFNRSNGNQDDDDLKVSGSSSSDISLDQEQRENWPAIGSEAIGRAKAFFGESLSVRKILAAVEAYTEEWVVRALEIAEMRGKKPGKLPVKSWGFVIRTLKNWEQEGGPPPEAPAAKPASANGKPASVAPAPTAVAPPRPVVVPSDGDNRSYAAKLLERLREQKKGGVPCDWRWDASENVYRYHGPEWIRTMMMPIQHEIFAILDGERAAKEAQP